MMSIPERLTAKGLDDTIARLKAEAPKHGAELFEEVGLEPTLDVLMQRDPRDLAREDINALVRRLRQERAFNIAASERKAEGGDDQAE